MTVHSVFGAGAPLGTFALYNDAGDVINMGSIFYVGTGQTGWTCNGAKLWVPSGVTLPATVTLEARYDVQDTTNNLDTAALRSVTVPTVTGPAWVEASWTPFTIAAGVRVLISYTFPSAIGSYLYATAADGNFISAADSSPLFMSENVDVNHRSYYKIGAAAPQVTLGGNFYGVDIVTDDGLTPAPIAAYGFNETSGVIAADSSGNHHDLTLNSTSNFDVSREGNGLHQLGGGSTYKITNATSWFEPAHRTMMFWGRLGSIGTPASSQTVYQTNGAAATVFGISLSDGVNASMTARINGTPVMLTAPQQAIGDWHHYALTYDGQTVCMYIDATLVASQAAGGTIDTSDGNLYFYGEDYQQQVIDDVRLFDAAVPPADIATYMNTVIAAPDVTPPTVPANVAATVVYQQVTLNWDASTDNTAVQNYVVYRSIISGFTPVAGDQVGGPSTTSYTESVAVGTYYYRVSARDEAGNESAAAAEVQVIATMNPNSDYYYPSGLGWTPGATYTDSNTSGQTLGTLVGVSSPVRIKGIRFYAPATASNCQIALYEDKIQKVTKSNVSLVVGWNELLFDTPYVAIPGSEYAGCIYLPPNTQIYSAQPNEFTVTRTNVGPIYSQSDASGRYDTGAIYPNNGSSAWYGIDIIGDSQSGPLDTGFGTDIVSENAKAGSNTSEWSITGAGDSTNLGFAREFSVNIGETVNFSCHGDGTVLDIYRIGYYGGLGWRKVITLTNTATQQPDPVVIPSSNGGITCTGWSTTASWTVPTDAMSGLFVGVYRNAAQNNASYIPFCVRDDAKPVDIIVKLSDTTWALSYNYYGTPSSPYTGKSVYGSGGPLGDITTRAHAATYHRPIITREGIPQTYWLDCEAPFIRYVESNGLNVKYVASKDVDTGLSVLANSKIVVSSGHDEYWSEGMRDTFAAYRDSGRHVLFMSGNEVFWRTRFSADHDTMWVYKDTMDGPGSHVGGTPLDPVSWTGTWKDTRWAGRQPENTITGTDFHMNGVNDKIATFLHTDAYATHPMWRNTSLTTTDFTVAGLIGFEADEILPTQPTASTAILANSLINIDGSRADDNGQSYNGSGNLNWGVVSQRYASGAVVVGFGTCQWSWGLDEVHDRGGNVATTPIQQATLNLLADLGAQVPMSRPNLTIPTPVPSLDVYGVIPAADGRSGKVKVWDGSAWQAHPVNVWDGTSWTTHKIAGQTGSQFVVGKD